MDDVVSTLRTGAVRIHQAIRDNLQSPTMHAIACDMEDAANLIVQLREDKARLDWLLGRCTVGTHVLGHKGQSHYAFQPFFTLRVQGGGREGIDDAMQNADAIDAIERQFETEEFNRRNA